MTSNTASIPNPSKGSSSNETQAILCDHCHLPVPTGLIDPAAEHQFCCNGCKIVYTMIHQHGLDSFYEIKKTDDAQNQPAYISTRTYLDFDDLNLLKEYATPLPDGHMAIQLHLQGVHCAACVWLIEKLSRICPGIIDVKLQFHRSILNLRWNPAEVKLSHIANLLNSLGYPPTPSRPNTTQQSHRQEDRKILIRIAIAAVAAGNTMMMSIPLYAGMFSGIEQQYQTLFRWASMIIAWLVVIFSGQTFFRGAIAAIRTRTPHLDLPIAIGLIAGMTAGTINTILGRGEIYFDSVTILVFLLLLGRWLQNRQQRRATQSLEMLYALTPITARRLSPDNTTYEVHVDSLQTNDIVEVRAGETVPVDGMLANGTSSLNLAFLTGESQPLEISIGQEIYAGSINLSATIQVTVSKTGRNTRMGKIAEQVEDAFSNRPPIVLFADRIAGWFVLTVLFASACTYAWWAYRGDPYALDHAIALLIVTCPCALGMATPLTLAITIGRAAQQHILIKGGDMIERLTHKGTIFLDKTGTLTEGHMTMCSITGDQHTHPLIAAVERHASHPIAKAFVHALDHHNKLESTHITTSNIQQTDQGGIKATVNGKSIRIGSANFVINNATIMPPWVEQAREHVIKQSHTPVLVAVNNTITNVAGFGDALRLEAAPLVSKLQADGWNIALLSGDHQQIVLHVAQHVGISITHAHGNLMPEDKLAHVQQAMNHNNVVMIGDGVNDTSALAAASVGIAVHGGAEASLQAAGIYLGKPGLNPIHKLINAASMTMNTIRWTLTASLIYNAIAIMLAAMGFLNPLVAALLMPLSSFTVLTIALACPAYRK